MSILASKQRQFIMISLLIPVLLLLMFVVYPSFELFRISFYKWDGISQSNEFIGLRNYIKVFTNSPDLWISLKNNGLYLLVHMLAIPFELGIAVMLNSKMKGREIVKVIIFLPFIISGVGISYAFAYFFSPVNGAFNAVLNFLGLGAYIQGWLSDPKVVNLTLCFVSLWRFSGYHVILFSAGLKSVPNELLEAAEIDGATTFEKFRYIQLPSMALVIDFVLFDCIRGTLQHFEIPFIMTQGGPGYASSTFTLYTIDAAFKFYDFGMASTMAVIIMALVVVVLFYVKRLTSKIIGGAK